MKTENQPTKKKILQNLKIHNKKYQRFLSCCYSSDLTVLTQKKDWKEENMLSTKTMGRDSNRNASSFLEDGSGRVMGEQTSIFAF